MSKAKTALTFSSIFTKIVIGVAAIALIACITILTVKCAKKNEKKEYYECTRYDWSYVSGSTPTTLDRLQDYEYYRLYLNSDNTFTIKYIAKSDETERSEGGTYVKKGNTYTLKYSSLPTQDIVSEPYEIVYHMEDGKLVREDRALAPNGTNYTIVQVFE